MSDGADIENEPPWDLIQEVIAESGDLTGSSFADVFEDYLRPFREKFTKDEAHFRASISAARERYAASGVPPTERQQLAISRIEAALEMLDQYLKKWPFFIIKRVLIRLAEADTVTTPEMVEQVRAAFNKSDLIQQSEIKHFLNLMMTEDPLGIILRGHVLVENALDQCIVAGFVKPQRLHDDLKMFYAEKVKLAYALGIVSLDERNILNALGTVRNSLVHYEATDKKPKPRYFVTVEEEERLWRQFRSLGISGPWPEYSQEKFPTHLKIMLTGLYMLLSIRSPKIKPAASQVGSHVIDQYFVTALTLFVVRHYPMVWNALGASA